MIASLITLLLGAALASALPVVEKRTVTSLNEAVFEESQQRDDTATRAFSSIPIKTSDGQCLFVDELSGDFRANLTPIQIAACDGSAGQSWDIITSGKHNNAAGSMLIVSTLTQACFNFDPRRAAGNQVLLFACGGRADGTGQVQNAQLFPFAGGAGPLTLGPESAPGTCLTVKGSVIDQATCNAADANQSFTFGDSGATTSATATSAPAASTSDAAANECSADPEEGDTEETSTTTTTTLSSTSATEVASTSVAVASTTASTTLLTVASSTTVAAAATSSSAIITTTTPPPTTTSATSTSASAVAEGAAPLSAVPVSRAGGVLNPSAAAQSNVFDTTATRAFTSVSLKSSSGLCLFIDPTAGDFRENLIPIALKPCDGSTNEKWDFITAGAHNNAVNSTLIVSSETNGCMNFDSRRAAGDTVIMFSCGGRADGVSQTTNSQLFPFAAGEKSITLAPENGAGAVCLVPNAAGTLLDQAPCSGDASQLFTIE